MVLQKPIRAMLIALVIIIGAILLSEWMLEKIARANDFEIGDLGGYWYKRVIVPLLSGMLAFFLVCIRKEYDLSWKSAMRIIGVFSVVALASYYMHISSINSGNIGWYKVPDNYNIQGKSLHELSRLLFHRNNEISHLALKELERRGPNASDMLLKLIEESRHSDPYHDVYQIRLVIELLAKQKDVRVIPILKEMLKSEYNPGIVTYRDGRRVVDYTTRFQAVSLLKKYFDIESNVETEKVLSSPGNHRKGDL